MPTGSQSNWIVRTPVKPVRCGFEAMRSPQRVGEHPRKCCLNQDSFTNPGGIQPRNFWVPACLPNPGGVGILTPRPKILSTPIQKVSKFSGGPRTPPRGYAFVPKSEKLSGKPGLNGGKKEKIPSPLSPPPPLPPSPVPPTPRPQSFFCTLCTTCCFE